jgi:predicted aspartyl protease
MPVHTYPFVAFSPGEIPRPYLWTKVINPDSGKSLLLYALLDTGADECALPASYAMILGHRLESGIPKTISTGNGNTTSYSHSSVIAFEKFETEKVTIDYMPNLLTPLLGFRSFLAHFILNISKYTVNCI